MVGRKKGDVKLTPSPQKSLCFASSNPLPECTTQVNNLTAYSHGVSAGQPHSKMRHGLLTGKAHVPRWLCFHFVSGRFGCNVLFMVIYCSLHISTQTILSLPIHLHYTHHLHTVHHWQPCNAFPCPYTHIHIYMHVRKHSYTHTQTDISRGACGVQDLYLRTLQPLRQGKEPIWVTQALDMTHFPPFN